ncbi:hypothetical protein H5410_046602 [Solanum commersonii]|uniref:Gag-pol polyprotein n=1 Tax=Solanum commersonii TaxID=4109 RepID=A0A9J5XGX4_SOLCO|nr:hypothetical protein H5410_046602 [Solanum commersonii]
MVADMRSRMSLFVVGLFRLSSKEGKADMLNRGHGHSETYGLCAIVSPPDKAAPRGATSGTSGGENCQYAITSLQEQDNLLDVVTRMIKVFTFDVYAFLDPGASLFFVTPYIAMNFDTLSEQLLEPFKVSTPVGESILAERVYCDCPIFVNHKSTMANIVDLVILCMD